MSTGRPEILFPLFADLTKLDGVGPKTAEAMERLAVFRPKDLLFLLPNSVIDRRHIPTVQGLNLPATATVTAEVVRHIPAKSRNGPYRILMRDTETEFFLVYFHAQNMRLSQSMPDGSTRVVSGKFELFDGIAQMAHPDFSVTPEKAATIPEFEAVYPLTSGITQRPLRRAVASTFSRTPALTEWIDASQMALSEWPSWLEALTLAHNPKSTADLSPTAAPRQRLAYDEFFAHQMTLALARAQTHRKTGVPSVGTGGLTKPVINALPFQPTGAQHRAFEEIAQDLGEPIRMNRLLQGDVGAGKTLVALIAALQVVEAGGQVALMAPTEILSRQHVAALRAMTQNIDISIDVLTGRDDAKSRADKRERLKSGQINLLVGTHALFQKSVEFQDLRLVIIDEQHRFGVRERMDLGAKGDRVDVLVMTATPIPRSLELTHYGDMDISILDEKPAGRMPIETVLIPDERLEDVVLRLQAAVADGRQAYWVCPLVEESEVMAATAAEERLKTLRKSLGEGVVGLVHGQMPPAEKDAAMADFVSGKTRVLVATTVIEVGVDVANASIMVIEGAEMFGLAQLHQLRGRVGRGAIKSTCLLMYSRHLTQSARDRLSIMRETNDGFRISEEDLRIRGAGDVLGVAQSGLPRFRIADPEHQAGLMAKARSDARALLELDPNLTSERGQAARNLLYLMDQDKAFRMLSVG